MDNKLPAQFYYQESATYRPDSSDMETWESEEALIGQALSILEKRLEEHRAIGNDLTFNFFSSLKKYLRLHLAQLDIERFDILLFDPDRRLIRHIPIAYGGTVEVTVYPREVTRLAVLYHADQVVVTHNHPIGKPIPSEPDKRLTEVLKAQLNVVGINLLDHVIVSREFDSVFSFSLNTMV